MGEVRRVLDRRLNRTVAMKVIRRGRNDDERGAARFVEEALVTARLQHPAIVPVHDAGRLPDGRLYFTMREIQGHTLTQLIAEVHSRPIERRWVEKASRWSLRALIGALRTVCDAVAYAHSHGVIHRDLKPSNIMLGDFGEVNVLDWGIAKVTQSTHAGPPRTADPLHRATSLTVEGAVPGTPAYLPPERLLHGPSADGPKGDVYALGAILYHILSGRPPYVGSRPGVVFQQILAGPPPAPCPIAEAIADDETLPSDDATGLAMPKEAPSVEAFIPETLLEIWRRAMARDPSQRYDDSGLLAAALQSWLDGVAQRDKALTLVEAADALLPELKAQRAKASRLRAEGEALLEAIKPWRSEEEKRPAWEQLDKAEALDRAADLGEVEHLQRLRAALSLAPDLPEAHARLANHYRTKHAAAEARRDDRAARQAEALLAAHDQGQHQAYLEGRGRLTLHTDPPRARVFLSRMVQQHRRLAPSEMTLLGETPLDSISLPMGSYLLTLRAPGRAEVRYPVHIEREGHWSGHPPGSQTPEPIYLPAAGELGSGEIYVPAGWFISGGDPRAFNGLPRQRIWVDAFVIQRFPVTNGDYLSFLDALTIAGEAALASAHAPQEPSHIKGQQGWPIYGQHPDGRHFLRRDQEGDLWLPQWPVTRISWHAAVAFAQWKSRGDGQGWRLPIEAEREKAARGVDGRFFPWGDFADPTWARNKESEGGVPKPAAVEAYPTDCSVYGLRGGAGNVRDWCLNGPQELPSHNSRATIPNALPSSGSIVRSVRGGSFAARPDYGRVATRATQFATVRGMVIGFRLARSLTKKTSNTL